MNLKATVNKCFQENPKGIDIYHIFFDKSFFNEKKYDPSTDSGIIFHCLVAENNSFLTSTAYSSKKLDKIGKVGKDGLLTYIDSIDVTENSSIQQTLQKVYKDIYSNKFDKTKVTHPLSKVLLTPRGWGKVNERSASMKFFKALCEKHNVNMASLKTTEKFSLYTRVKLLFGTPSKSGSITAKTNTTVEPVDLGKKNKSKT